jgi:hypothetical protein
MQETGLKLNLGSGKDFKEDPATPDVPHGRRPHSSKGSKIEGEHMSIEAMRQARNAFVWNLNTDLDNISACEQWANMLRKNIDDLDKAIADAELKWVGLTDEEANKLWESTDSDWELMKRTEAKLKEKNK